MRRDVDEHREQERGEELNEKMKKSLICGTQCSPQSWQFNINRKVGYQGFTDTK